MTVPEQNPNLGRQFIHLSPDDVEMYRGMHQAAKMHHDLAQSAERRMVKTSDPVDLKAHLLEGHDLEHGDLWRNSHDEDHPALKRAGNDDRPLSNAELLSLHNHDHASGEYQGVSMGEEHWH